MEIKEKVCVLFLACGILLHPGILYARENVKIVTATPTLASLCKEIMGEEAEIYAVASPNRDIHFYAPTPKDVLKVKKAGVFIHEGLDLEAWRDPLLVAAGNPRFLGGGNSSIDVSKGVSLLEVPTSLSRAEGDVHLYGNPHYWTDPANAKIMANNIAEGLAKIFSDKADSLRKNAAEFNRKIDEKMKDWLSRLARHKGAAVVTYHRNWPYFAKRFGLVIVGELEPKPGIPPTAKHLAELVRIMKEKKVKAILKESYQESRTPKKIAQETGAKVLKLAQHVGEEKEARDYFSMIEYNVKVLEEALNE